MRKSLASRIYFQILTELTSWNGCHRSIAARLTLVILGFILAYSTICYRLICVATLPHTAKVNKLVAHSSRKEIADRNGNLLAVNIPAPSLFANPKHMITPEKDIARLSKVIPDLDTKKLLVDLKSDKTFVWIKHDLTPKEQQEINDLGIAGIYFEPGERRIYTYGNLLSHVLGYVGRDSLGLAGLEKSYDDFLKEGKSGDNLALTIDVRVQNIVAEELDKVMTKFRAVGGVGMVVDPNNGEIIALVSKPDFDPHHPSKSTPEQLFNRASLGIYEMGSVMKSITMAIGFDTNTITMHDAYNLSSFRVANFQLKDYHKSEGWHSVADIFLHSSNIGVAQIALETGKSEFKSYLQKLGFFDQVPIEIPERGMPLYPKASEWSDLSLATMSYGYAMSVSPLHFMQAMLPVINGGYLYPLSIVKKNSHKEGTKVFDKSTSDNIKKLMRLVITHGTGKKAEVKGYLVAGKTGTANKQQGKHYVNDSRRSSFFALFPATDPKYAVYMMLDEPKGTKETFGFATAGWTAAPAVGDIISRMVALYGMQPHDEEEESLELQIEYKIDEEV